MKYLRTTMPDESQWDVPAELIAKSRAAYYAKLRAAYYAKLDSKRGGGSYDAIYARELEYTLADPDKLEDWAANNMNWSDVSHAAVRVPSKATDYQEGWVNGEKEVVEKP